LEIRSKDFLEEINNSDILCIDSPILIYHLEKVKPYDELTRILIKKIADSHTSCIISALTITELLTKPFRLKDDKKVALFEEFIKSMPNTTVKPIDYEISKKAASLRADHNLRTPDSLILSTAINSRSELFITNDIALKKIKMDELKTIVLDDYIES